MDADFQVKKKKHDFILLDFKSDLRFQNLEGYKGINQYVV